MMKVSIRLAALFVLLLGLTFQAQAQTSDFNIVPSTTLAQLQSHYGAGNVAVESQISTVAGIMNTIVTITHADGTQTTVYMHGDRVIAVLGSQHVFVVFNRSVMEEEFPTEYSIGTPRSAQNNVVTVRTGGDNTASGTTLIF